jgi:hypothetical protein
VQHDAARGGDLTDLLGRGAADGQPAVVGALGLDAPRRQCSEQQIGVGGADAYAARPGAPDQLVGGCVGNQLAAADDDQPVRHQRHLAHEMTGDEDRLADRGKVLEQVAHPEDALRVQAVDRLVEQEHLRVAEEGGCDAEPLSHAEGEAARALLRHLAQPDEVEYLVDPSPLDRVGLRDPDQMVVRAAPAVQSAGLEQRADLVQRVAMCGVRLAVHRDVAGGRGVEPEDHSHRRRLAGAVRAEEAGDDTRLNREGQLVDRESVAVPLGQRPRLDHEI